MLYRIFSLHPQIFNSFLESGLIARGINQKIITTELINWRDSYGVGGYKQIDDRPFGGGQGMVLQVDPIYNALVEYNAVSSLFEKLKAPDIKDITHENAKHERKLPILPNNSRFFEMFQANPQAIKQATISLTPRGFPINQQVIGFLSGFETLNLLCGRYEGFDARVGPLVDMELSLGNFVLNGGEVGAMAVMEAVSRLLPGFISKPFASSHDSFSSQLNYYSEQSGYSKITENLKSEFQGFDDDWWIQSILPQIEHPQFTRPEVWQGYQTPKVLIEGNHKLTQQWRQNWYKN